MGTVSARQGAAYEDIEIEAQNFSVPNYADI
jgi:hypothetical protein